MQKDKIDEYFGFALFGIFMTLLSPIALVLGISSVPFYLIGRLCDKLFPNFRDEL